MACQCECSSASSTSASTTTLSRAHTRARARTPSTSLSTRRSRALGGLAAGAFSRDQTTQCIGAALEIRGVLRTVGELLAQPELAALTDGLAEAALDCQDKFARLLEAAREEALGLVGRLEEFAQGMGRLVRGGGERVSSGFETRGSVVTVYATATQSSCLPDAGTQEQMEALNATLETLEKRAVACTIELEAYAKGPLEEIAWKVEALEGYVLAILATRGRLITRLFNNFFATPPSEELLEPLMLDYHTFPEGWKLAPFIQDQVRACAEFQAYVGSQSAVAAAAWELEQKKRELERSRRAVETKRAEVKKALLCLSAVSRHFAVLDGKLGEFEDGLAILVDDVQGLSDRLDGPSGAVEEFRYNLYF